MAATWRRPQLLALVAAAAVLHCCTWAAADTAAADAPPSQPPPPQPSTLRCQAAFSGSPGTWVRRRTLWTGDTIPWVPNFIQAYGHPGQPTYSRPRWVNRPAAAGSGPACAAQDLLLGFDELPPTSILVVGDSVNRHMGNDTAQYLGVPYRHLEWPVWAKGLPVNNETAEHYDRMWGFGLRQPAVKHGTYRGGPLYYWAIHTGGAAKEGPFHQGLWLNAQERTEQALQTIQRLIKGPPDVVLISMNLWDAARLHTFHLHSLSIDGVLLSTLPSEVVERWTADFVDYVKWIKQRLPQGTFFVYHTTALPSFLKASTGTRSWIRQLNEAGKQVAEREGLFVLDLELLTSHLEPKKVLRDEQHPRPAVLLELFNMLLNAWSWNLPAATAEPAEPEAEG